MNRHLVTIEVGVERGTNQWMKLNCFSLYQNRFKCLNTKSVQCRSTVQHNRMLFNNLFQDIPYLWFQSLDHLLGILNIVGSTVCHQFFHNKRLEQLNRHLLWQTALINLQFRSNNDNGTSGIVNSFSQQVLTETSGFTF